MSWRIVLGTDPRATTRQAFQMYGIRKDNIKEVIGTIVRSIDPPRGLRRYRAECDGSGCPLRKGGYPAARQLANDIADVLSPQSAEGSYLDLWVDGI